MLGNVNKAYHSLLEESQLRFLALYHCSVMHIFLVTEPNMV